MHEDHRKRVKERFLKDGKREEVHALFAMVLQDTWVFDGTLRENLVYNNKDVTEDDIKNAR